MHNNRIPNQAMTCFREIGKRKRWTGRPRKSVRAPAKYGHEMERLRRGRRWSVTVEKLCHPLCSCTWPD